jgi:hypothetical protein
MTHTVGFAISVKLFSALWSVLIDVVSIYH